MLELGCGTGRHTRTLLRWGLRPTAVDNSPEMLAELPAGAIPVSSAIETLALRERFDIALLASCLINHPSSHARSSYVAAASNHLKPGAQFLIERHDPQWLQGVEVGVIANAGSVVVSLESVNRVPPLVEMKLRYSVAGQEWTQSFVAAPLAEREIEVLLSEHGFHSFSWHGSARRWIATTFGHQNVAKPERSGR